MTTHFPAKFAKLLPGNEEAGFASSFFRISLLHEVRATKKPGNAKIFPDALVLADSHPP